MEIARRMPWFSAVQLIAVASDKFSLYHCCCRVRCPSGYNRKLYPHWPLSQLLPAGHRWRRLFRVRYLPLLLEARQALFSASAIKCFQFYRTEDCLTSINIFTDSNRNTALVLDFGHLGGKLAAVPEIAATIHSRLECIPRPREHIIGVLAEPSPRSVSPISWKAQEKLNSSPVDSTSGCLPSAQSSELLNPLVSQLTSSIT
jgi:hypothetical protein